MIFQYYTYLTEIAPLTTVFRGILIITTLKVRYISLSGNSRLLVNICSLGRLSAYSLVVLMKLL